jgi:hypothetical protein
MGCGCQKSSAGGAWIYVDGNGVGQEYPSEVEAKAAKIRNGGGGFVKKA